MPTTKGSLKDRMDAITNPKTESPVYGWPTPRALSGYTRDAMQKFALNITK